MKQLASKIIITSVEVFFLCLLVVGFMCLWVFMIPVRIVNWAEANKDEKVGVR